MQQYVGRFLAQQGVIALVVNVVINAGVGWLLYREATAVPLTGEPSIAGDTIIGAFLIGVFTIRIVAPVTRRQVRAGRVVGGGPATRARLPGWLERRPWLGAFLGGLVIAAVCGGGAVATLAFTGTEALATTPFLGFKVGFAGVIGAAVAVLVAAVAIAGVDEPADDPRWCRDPDADVAGPVYPCDFVDKGGVAVTSAEHGCSATPTWHLVVRGRLDPDAVRAAVGDLLVRYPSLRSRIQSLDARPEYARRLRYAHAPAIGADDVFDVVDLRGRPTAELDALADATCNRFLDQFTEPPMTVTMAILGDDESRLLVRQHHGIADGRAFIELLEDFAGFLDARLAGRAPAAEALAPIGRVPEIEVLGLGRARRAWWTVLGVGLLARAVLRGLARPTTPLLHNDSNDYTGANGTVHWVIDAGAVDAWRAAQKRVGASANSLLTAALFLANQRWHRALGRPLGRTNGSLIMETRPRDGSVRSFANHLATLEVELPLGRELDPAEAARAIQRQVDRQRQRSWPIKRQLFERVLVLALPIDAMRPMVFESRRPAYNLNLSNLIALPFPTLGGAGWQVDEVLITTPVTPRNGIVVTVIRYRDRVCFNANYAETAATAEHARALLGHLRDALEELTGHVAVELDTAAARHIGGAAPAASAADYSQLAPSA